MKRLPVYWQYDHYRPIGYAVERDGEMVITIVHKGAVEALSADSVKGISLGYERAVTPRPEDTETTNRPHSPLKSLAYEV